MTELRPCSACQRHVAISASTCPFCEVALAPAVPRPIVRGRLSRAAVFASAALATTAACGGTKPKTDTTNQTATTDAGVEQPADAAVVQPPDDEYRRPPDHMIPKPYGAPPARRRVV